MYIYIERERKHALQYQSLRPYRLAALRVEYAERGHNYGILFIFTLICEYTKPQSDQFPVRVCSCPVCIINRL